MHIIIKTLDHLVTAILGIFCADFGRNGKSGRHRHAEKVHFSKVRSLAAEKVTHRSIALSMSVTERVNSFHFCKGFSVVKVKVCIF